MAMGWFTSKPHETKDDKGSILGSKHTDIDFRNETTGKVDRDAGKGYVSGESRQSNYIDPLSDPGNPGSDAGPAPGGQSVDVN